MGQNINPLGFRLGTTESHHSLWFAQPKKYCEGLEEDKKICVCIKNYVQKNIRISSGMEEIARIKIQKRIDLIQVIISMGFPKLLIEDQPHNCVNRKLNIAITRISTPYGHPNILAEFMVGQLKNRVSFRKAMKKAIELTEQANTKGIKVQIAGRIDGKKLHVLNGSEKAEFLYTQLKQKLIIVHIQFELFMGS